MNDFACTRRQNDVILERKACAYMRRTACAVQNGKERWNAFFLVRSNVNEQLPPTEGAKMRWCEERATCCSCGNLANSRTTQSLMRHNMDVGKLEKGWNTCRLLLLPRQRLYSRWSNVFPQFEVHKYRCASSEQQCTNRDRNRAAENDDAIDDNNSDLTI